MEREVVVNQENEEPSSSSRRTSNQISQTTKQPKTTIEYFPETLINHFSKHKYQYSSYAIEDYADSRNTFEPLTIDDLRSLIRKEVISQQIIRMVLLGDSFVGKTSIFRRIQKVKEDEIKFDSDAYTPSIGSDFVIIQCFSTRLTIPFQIHVWDQASPSFYQANLKPDYSNMHIFLIVLDHQNPETLTSLSDKLAEIENESKLPLHKIHIMIALNKSKEAQTQNRFDLKQVYKQVNEYYHTKHPLRSMHKPFVDCFEISAKERPEEIERMMEFIIHERADPSLQQYQNKRVPPATKPPPPPTQKTTTDQKTTSNWCCFV